jgi:hypothetical protein
MLLKCCFKVAQGSILEDVRQGYDIENLGYSLAMTLTSHLRSVKLHIGFLSLFPLLKVEKAAKVEKRRRLFQARCIYFSSAFKSGFGFYK